MRFNLDFIFTKQVREPNTSTMFSFLFTLALVSHLSEAQPSVGSPCLQRPDTGSCRAYLPSFYFNVQTGSCDCFVYGGCAPGGNNFETLQVCMMTCGINQATQVMSRDCRRILANVNVGRPIGQNDDRVPSTNKTDDRPLAPQPDLSQSEGQRPSASGLSVPNQRPEFNESTVHQLQTIFNDIKGKQPLPGRGITASSRPSLPDVSSSPSQKQDQPQPSFQRPTSGTTGTRPVLPPPLPFPPPVLPPPLPFPPRRTTHDEKEGLMTLKGNRRRPASSPVGDQALQRQIEQQKQMERQLQQTIDQHQQLQTQQQQEQQAQLQQQQLQQRQQHQQQIRKQQEMSR